MKLSPGNNENMPYSGCFPEFSFVFVGLYCHRLLFAMFSGLWALVVFTKVFTV